MKHRYVCFELQIVFSNHCHLIYVSIYVGHFRSFVYDVIVITKYKITTHLIFLNVYTCVLSVITSTVHKLYPSMW